MLARFCSRSKPLQGLSARARFGSKIDFVIFARARLGSKIFSLGSLELEKFTLVPNTMVYVFWLVIANYKAMQMVDNREHTGPYVEYHLNTKIILLN